MFALPRRHPAIIILSAALFLPVLARAQAPVYVTQWGTFGSGEGQFNYPGGIACDTTGNVYVADRYNYRVQKFANDGTYLAQWGSFGDGNGQFHEADDIAIDRSGVYVADANSRRVQVFGSDGTYITQWPCPAGANDVAIDGVGNVYVLGGFSVAKFTNSGDFIAQWGTSGTGPGEFQYADGIAAADGYVYVADTDNHRIQKFTDDGTFVLQWGSLGTGNGEFSRPYSVAVGGYFGELLYVADFDNHRVQVFDSFDGDFITQWGAPGNGDGQFQFPGEVATFGSDIFVGDIGNSRIQKFGPAPSILHSITATSGPGGVISPGGDLLVGDGSDILFVFYAFPEFRVDQVIVDGTPLGPLSEYLFHSVTSDHTIHVDFALLNPPPPPPPPPPPLAIEANQIRMLVAPGGWFAFDPETFSAGLEFPKGSGKTMLFTSGLWLGALVDGQTRVSVAEYSDQYQRGAMVGGVADDPTRPEYHVYRLDRHYVSTAVRDSELVAYNAGAVPYGAPIVTVLPGGDLDILGDQMLWHVYNDAGPFRFGRPGSIEPLGVEVQQTAYAFNRLGALGNTVFMKFRIINKGVSLLQDLHASLWSDPDLGGYNDDLVGSDPPRSMGYCYNATNNDAIYGSSPPAIGYDLLGARKFDDASPMHATAFMQYLNGQDPQDPETSYRYMRGLLANGDPIIHPVTQLPTTFFYDGDPVTGTGWLDTNPSDRRFMLSAGPFTLAPGETLEVVSAIVIGDGTDRLSSVAKLRSFDDDVQAFFDGIPTCQVAMSLALSPSVLNLHSVGRWITGRLEPATPWTPDQIDVSTIRLNGSVPVDPSAAVTIGDFDQDGIQELEVKFDRGSLELTLEAGDAVPVEVTGGIGDQCFTGAANVRVIRGVVTFPTAGSVLEPGLTQVTWDMPSGASLETVGIMASFDDGAHWHLVAGVVANSGHFDWSVPNTSTDQARLAIVVIGTTASGSPIEGVVAISGRFSIHQVTGIDPGGNVSFALRGVTPNPARDALRVSYSLRDSGPAKLALYDVTGRMIEERRVERAGPGWHLETFGDKRQLPPGLYLIRLTQHGNSLVTRAVLVR